MSAQRPVYELIENRFILRILMVLVDRFQKHLDPAPDGVIDLPQSARLVLEPCVSRARAERGAVSGSGPESLRRRKREERSMRVHVYELLMAMQRSRRDVLKGAAGAAATLAASSAHLVVDASFRPGQRRRPGHENPRRRKDLPRTPTGRRLANSALGRRRPTCSPASSRASISPSWVSTTRTCTTSCSADF